ncbi:hypothetical protein EX895_001749 [Sporisorium graminicola]|uniref:Uncharacterized protein n=1 Tax=Sporisorium graminicola TaxID=280036 RepID=A0A4U7L0F3_9BASI|nr:hypothetical protein EX895_001749 [Sporisorium graminicola]TKY89218.1 hypothetical protein EX895_001749 [Sporisorium graminicola]
MSISPSTSMPQHTSLVPLDDIVSAPLDTPTDATACCDTFSDEQQTSRADSGQREIRLGRRPFQRLPIPGFVASSGNDTHDESEAASDASVGEWLGNEHGTEREGRESFPQSPGESLVSRFSPYQEERSPAAALFSRLVFGFHHAKDRRSRSRSSSDTRNGKQLHPSPPPAPRGGIELEPEDLVVVPKRKTGKRKPIPASLFAFGGGSREGPQLRSASVPDVFAETHFTSNEFGEEGIPHAIEARNSLGLFLPPPIEQQHATEAATATDPSVPDKVSQDSSLAFPPQQRLKRATRSISETHNRARRRFASLDADTTTAVGSARDNAASASLSDSSDSDSGGDDRRVPHSTKRGRTRSGSAPVYPSSSAADFAEQGEGERRYSIDQESRPLRRILRTRKGEMRSVYLSRTPPPTGAYPTSRHLQPLPLIQNLAAGEDGEVIEVLKTPEAASQPSFPLPRAAAMSSPAYASTASTRASFDSMHTRAGGAGSDYSDYGSLGPESGESLAMSTASMLVLQQQIQMQNYQMRELGVIPTGMVGAMMGRGVDGEERMSKRVVDAEKAKEGQDGLVQQYGAMRLGGRSSSEFESDREEARSSQDSDSRDRQGGAAGGLRHMVSDSVLAASSKEAEGSIGSLRQRRAKPPISIALAPSHKHSTSTNGTSSSRFSADLIGAAIPLRKKLSRSVLSPTATSGAIHSPPPCPPPSTPLPDLPVPRSAPLVAADGRRTLASKRSFVRSSSTPVSPHDAHPPSQRHRAQRGAPKSQSCTLDPAPAFTRLPASASASTSHDGGSTADSSVLHTPPLTGGLPFAFTPIYGVAPQREQQQFQQPVTPLSAQTDTSVATPVSAQPRVVGVVGGKFDSLLAFLSSDHSGADKGDAGERRRQSKAAAEGGGANDVLVATSSAASDEVVYGLAL